MTPKEAIKAIVHYNTLPQQIDYRAPQRMAALAAEDYLDTLPDKEVHYQEVRQQIDDYYAPTSMGYSAAEMNNMM